MRAGSAPSALDTGLWQRHRSGDSSHAGNRFRVIVAADVTCFVSENGLTKPQAGDQHYYWRPH